MMPAASVMGQNNGAVTLAYYQALGALGPAGQIAVALFRAQKRSSRAKDYRPGRYRRAAYDVKEWSIGELCRLLTAHGEHFEFVWGWKQDPKVLFGEEPSWVLYVDIPVLGQVSFHCPNRGDGPVYAGEWDGSHQSAERIIIFCDSVKEAADQCRISPS